MPKQAQLKTSKSTAELEELYRETVYLRKFEEKSNETYRKGESGGYLHVYIGMEALAVGWLNAIRKGDDYVITAYRDHAHALLLGSDPVAVMAEIMGRSGGLSRGKGGSMHLYDPAHGLYGGWGIVGGHVPLGAGLAFSSRYRGDDKVTLCFMGDGASNAGVVFESLNMSGLWDLPIIYIVENNEIAMGTRLEYHAADPDLSKRGFPFGIEYERLDGMDAVQTSLDAQRIVDKVRREKKPYFVEMLTYRYAGHGAADNNRELYRTKDEETEAWKRDPVHRLAKTLVEMNVMNDEKLEAVDAEIEARVEDIYQKALASPEPEAHEVYDNVYTDMEPERGH